MHIVCVKDTLYIAILGKNCVPKVQNSWKIIICIYNLQKICKNCKTNEKWLHVFTVCKKYAEKYAVQNSWKMDSLMNKENRPPSHRTLEICNLCKNPV